MNRSNYLKEPEKVIVADPQLQGLDAFFVLVVSELILLFAGLGFVFSLWLNQPALSILMASGFGLSGLLFGVVIGKLSSQTFQRNPDWLWLVGSTSLLALLSGLVSYFLNASGLIVGFAGTGGALLGTVLGLVLSHRFGAGTAESKGGPAIISPELKASLAQKKLPDQEIKRLRKTLYQELYRLKQQPSTLSQSFVSNFTVSPDSQLFVLDDKRVAVTCKVGTHLGELSFYIACNTRYPEEPPTEVYMELVSERYTNNQPRTIDYEMPLDKNWTSGCDLGTVVKEGILQVEEAILN